MPILFYGRSVAISVIALTPSDFLRSGPWRAQETRTADRRLPLEIKIAARHLRGTFQPGETFQTP
jgi:hypothetical protein